MKRPDIAFVIGSMRIGGAERATLNLINGLVLKGWKIDLILLHQTGDFLSKVDPKINVFNLNKRKSSQGLLVFRKYLVESNPAKLFVVQNHIQIMVLLAIKLTSWKGKVILNEQTTFLKNLHGLKGSIQKILSKILFPTADCITAVSDGVASELKELFPRMGSRIKVLYNPVITSEFEAISKMNVEHLFFNSGSKVIITAGRLTKSKNFELLIRAFNIVRKNMPSKLIILGDGEEMQNLKDLKRSLHLTNDVSLPGFVKEPSAYFSKADLFVLSSDYEGLPGVIIEALASGCKVVSTDCKNGPREILMDEKFGWLCQVGNANEMAEKIQVALNTTIDKSVLIKRANDFHQDGIVDRYIELFNTLK
jgi:glycosyltransferase involved in cell wall biosynthesis